MKIQRDREREREVNVKENKNCTFVLKTEEASFLRPFNHNINLKLSSIFFNSFYS